MAIDRKNSVVVESAPHKGDSKDLSMSPLRLSGNRGIAPNENVGPASRGVKKQKPSPLAGLAKE
jgi:hypothetical protein